MLSEKQQERIQRLAKPEMFTVVILLDRELLSGLEVEELNRLNLKIEVMKERFERQLVSMVKGTIKYRDGDLQRTKEEWLKFLREEFEDIGNYFDLMELQEKLDA